jgi:hypothetical protein
MPSTQRSNASASFTRRLSLAALCGSMLCACQDDAPPPPAGAEGPVLMREWKSDSTEPITVWAQTVTQRDKEFKQLDLKPVLVRMPFKDKIIYISAPKAVYNAGSRNAVQLDGPVIMFGTEGDNCIAGRADRALVDPEERTAELMYGEVISGGYIYEAGKRILFNQNTRKFSEGDNKFTRAPAVVTAALAALPQPMVLPELHK